MNELFLVSLMWLLLLTSPKAGAMVWLSFTFYTCSGMTNWSEEESRSVVLTVYFTVYFAKLNVNNFNIY